MVMTVMMVINMIAMIMVIIIMINDNDGERIVVVPQQYPLLKAANRLLLKW